MKNINAYIIEALNIRKALNSKQPVEYLSLVNLLSENGYTTGNGNILDLKEIFGETLPKIPEDIGLQAFSYQRGRELCFISTGKAIGNKPLLTVYTMFKGKPYSFSVINDNVLHKLFSDADLDKIYNYLESL